MLEAKKFEQVIVQGDLSRKFFLIIHGKVDVYMYKPEYNKKVFKRQLTKNFSSYSL